VDLAKYHTAAAAIENFIVRPEGGLIRRPGSRFAGHAKFASKLCRLVPFQFSTVQAYVLEFGDAYLRVWKDHGSVEAAPGTPYEIALPYVEANLATLGLAQSADVLYIAHSAHAPRKLSRTGHTAWTLSTYQPTDGPFLERNTDAAKTIAASGETGTVTLTASAPLFEPGHVGALWWLQMPDLAAVSPWESDVAAPTVNSYCRYNGNYYKALTIGSSNKTGTVPPTHDEGAGYDGIGTKNVRWAFQHKGAGVVRITAYLGPTSATAEVMKQLPHTVVGAATSKWAEGAWSSVRGWPAAVSFHEQRLLWANTPTRPQTIWASASGDYERMEAGTRDDDAFTYGIASAQVNAIRWLASGAALIVGTAGQEFAASAGALGDPLTPSSVRFVPQSGEGAAAVEPARLGSETLFVNRAGRKVLALLYNVDADAYLPVDLLQLAEHLAPATATIMGLAWARAPLNTLWAVRSDGLLLSLTYRRAGLCVEQTPARRRRRKHRRHPGPRRRGRRTLAGHAARGERAGGAPRGIPGPTVRTRQRERQNRDALSRRRTHLQRRTGNGAERPRAFGGPHRKNRRERRPPPRSHGGGRRDHTRHPRNNRARRPRLHLTPENPAPRQRRHGHGPRQSQTHRISHGARPQQHGRQSRHDGNNNGRPHPPRRQRPNRRVPTAALRRLRRGARQRLRHGRAGDDGAGRTAAVGHFGGDATHNCGRSIITQQSPSWPGLTRPPRVTRTATVMVAHNRVNALPFSSQPKARAGRG
jgi:hypothetical protein